MRFLRSSLFLCGFLFSSLATSSVQSTFEGPVKLKVWQHWQQSWNVERDDSFAPKFRLERGVNGVNQGYAVLNFHQAAMETFATLSCEGLERSGQWDVGFKHSPPLSAKGRVVDGKTMFSFEAASSCVDVDNIRMVSKIRIQITRGADTLFETEVVPMYLRGKGQSYYDNTTDSYMAHAGKGELSIAGLMKAEDKKNDKHWDLWNGILVKPILSFVDRNTLGKGAEIGLHRHAANQEAYFLESGKGEMWMGKAPFFGKSYSTRRKINENWPTWLLIHTL